MPLPQPPLLGRSLYHEAQLSTHTRVSVWNLDLIFRFLFTVCHTPRDPHVELRALVESALSFHCGVWDGLLFDTA